MGKSTIEGGSSFVAAAASIRSIQDVRAAYHNFLSKPGRLAAAHNLAAYRLYSPHTTKTEEGWEDDGDHGAGKKLLDLLHRQNRTNTVVFLSRGSAGSHLGPRRHKIMAEVAESALSKL